MKSDKMTGHWHPKKKKESRHRSFSKINSKQITYLSKTCRITKLIEYNIENVDDLGYNNDFLDTVPKAWSMIEIIDNLNFIKIINFCSAKDTVKRMRRQSTDWQKIFAKDIWQRTIAQNI